MGLGILQRYVMAEVLRSFVLALVALTSVIVLFMVMVEATRNGLSPREVLWLLPFVVPNSLPYTVPVSLLLSVCVVFGRLASDNEIVAIKTAGLSALTVLGPAFTLGALLSAAMVYGSHGPIPLATLHGREMIFKNKEDFLYAILKKEHEINLRHLDFVISVRDVEDRTLLDAIFKHRKPRERDSAQTSAFDAVITAKRARLAFDAKKGLMRVYLDEAEFTRLSQNADVSLVNDSELEMATPEEPGLNQERRLMEMTTSELSEKQSEYLDKIERERLRQAIRASLAIGAGRIGLANWKEVQTAYVDYNFWDQQYYVLETEKQQRTALGFGSLFFVILGAPVGILFARRDFLSAFITCFTPIIVLYYPLTLLGMNLGKENILNPTAALWMGNSLLGLLACFALPPILKH